MRERKRGAAALLILLLLVAAIAAATLVTATLVTDPGVYLPVGIPATGPRKCQRLRAPLHNIEHQLVHIESLENIDALARGVCARRGVKAHRCGPVVRELLDAAQEMATLDVTEAVVNVTLDYSLEFSLTQWQLPPVEAPPATPQDAAGGDRIAVGLTDAPVGMLVVLPEEPLERTVANYCVQNSMTNRACAKLFIDVEAQVVSYWGCDKDTTHEPPEPPISAALDRVRQEIINNQRQQEVKHARIAVSISASDADEQSVELTLDAASDLNLQVALFCRKHALLLASCETLLRRAHNVTRTAPAFEHLLLQQQQAQAQLTRLNVTSPAPSRMYLPSRRLHLELDPLPVEADSDPILCVFVDYIDTPAMCTPELWVEPKYFDKYTLSLGHHMLTFASLRTPDAATRLETLRASTVEDSEWVTAVHFDVVEPRIEFVRVDLETVTTSASSSAVYVLVTVRTAHFDVSDPEHRLCILHNDIFECLSPHVLTVVHDARESAALDRSMVLRAPIFNVSAGLHEVTLMLLDEYSTALAVAAPFAITVDLHDGVEPLMHYNASTFVDARSRVPQRPHVCPDGLRANKHLRWICELWRHEWGQYSQNGEDGVLRSIFANIGVQHKEYVEFGTEDGRECNTRFWRETYNWTGLLMDGRFENAAINLHREFVTAENVNTLFAKHGVSRHFDLLSVDVDFNDYWILDALDLARFAPRVVVSEYNSHVPAEEARAVRYDAARGWDGKSDYFGASMRALESWGVRHDYSLVYCESHGVNCFLVHNDALGANVSALLHTEDVFVPPNFFGKGWSYPNESRAGDDWVWVA